MTPSNAEQLFTDDIVADLIRRGVVITPGRYKRPKASSVWLYLVWAEVNGCRFQKIGLSADSSPLHRDRKAYKSIIHAVRVPTDAAAAIEAFAYGLCRNRHSDSDHRLWVKELSGWDGASETIFSEQEVTESFLEAVSLSNGLSHDQIKQELERCWYLQKKVVNIYHDPKRLKPEVKRLRKMLCIETLEQRNKWGNSNGWA